jgi:hypothetical protein
VCHTTECLTTVSNPIMYIHIDLKNCQHAKIKKKYIEKGDKSSSLIIIKLFENKSASLPVYNNDPEAIVIDILKLKKHGL